MTANDPEACSLKRIAAGEDQREGWYYAVNDYDAQVSMDAHLAKLKLIVIDAFHLETRPPKNRLYLEVYECCRLYKCSKPLIRAGMAVQFEQYVLSQSNTSLKKSLSAGEQEIHAKMVGRICGKKGLPGRHGTPCNEEDRTIL